MFDGDFEIRRKNIQKLTKEEIEDKEIEIL